MTVQAFLWVRRPGTVCPFVGLEQVFRTGARGGPSGGSLYRLRTTGSSVTQVEGGEDGELGSQGGTLGGQSTGSDLNTKVGPH